MNTADIERFEGGVIRVFAPGNNYGDPYEYAVAFKTVNDQTIEFVGITTETVPKPSQWRAVREACRAQGLRARFERRTGAKVGRHELE